jgi:hypothetical protein
MLFLATISIDFMEELNLYKHKSKPNNHGGSKPKEIIESAGKNLLVQWNIRYKNFCDERSFDKYFEKGANKPDLIISYNEKPALLIWNGEQTKSLTANKQAIEFFERLQKDIKIPILICFITLDKNEFIAERRFAVINNHASAENKKPPDIYKTVIFKSELPIFNKENLLKLVFELNN